MIIRWRGLNTFGLDAVAEWYIEIENRQQVLALHRALQADPHPLLWLGGGSNLVLAPGCPGWWRASVCANAS